MTLRRQALSLAAPLLAALCLGAGAAATLTADGYGAVTIGMTRAQVIKALGADITPDSGDFENCYMSQVVGGTPDLWFMFEDGRLTAIETGEASSVRTDTGIHRGSPEADVRLAYGKAVRREADPYMSPDWHDLYVWRSKTRGLRFDINEKGRVENIYVGSKSIRYSEGCA